MWPEISKAKNEKRRELLLVGEDFSKRIDSEGLPSDIFELFDLNFLRISNTSLNYIDPKIAGLSEKLTDLDLHQNKLSELPGAIGSLSHLKSLNLSGNSLGSLPSEISNLSSLLTLNICHNQFESINISGLTNLHELLVTGNKFSELPTGVTDLEQLLILQADYNSITALPSDIHRLSHLKELRLSNNSLTDLPLSLALLEKLHVLDLRGNKFSDRRLNKLANVDQVQPKGVFKFLKPLYDKQAASSKGSSKGGAGGSRNKKAQNDANSQVDEITDLIEVLHCADATASRIEVHISEKAFEIRPYIVCCILRNIDLTRTSSTFKQFIALQTRLHDGICEKRVAATIATHELRAVKPPLLFDALDPESTMITPLGRQKAVSASAFVKKLQKEADEMRKAKKRNNTTGIHKYLDLLKDKPLYPFLLDREGAIISFPPITNCDFTKISSASTDVLVEVTSNKSLNLCKQVMDQFIYECHNLKIASAMPVESSSDEESDEESATRNCLVVEQVKVTNTAGDLKTIYPSRTDLVDIPIHVERR